jgi:hypothetical protein
MSGLTKRGNEIHKEANSPETAFAVVRLKKLEDLFQAEGLCC